MLGQPHTTQRRAREVASDEGALRGDIVRLASRFGRYGYRRVTDMLRIEGWGVKHKRVERIWRQEGLKVPERQPKRGRLWLNDGSCIRLRPLYRGHVWSYDFVASRTYDGRALKLLTVLDEHTRECLAIVVARKIRSHDVLEVLADLFVRHGPPEYLRSDNGGGPGFLDRSLRWIPERKRRHRDGQEETAVHSGVQGTGSARGAARAGQRAGDRGAARASCEPGDHMEAAAARRAAGGVCRGRGLKR